MLPLSSLSEQIIILSLKYQSLRCLRGNRSKYSQFKSLNECCKIAAFKIDSVRVNENINKKYSNMQLKKYLHNNIWIKIRCSTVQKHR